MDQLWAPWRMAYIANPVQKEGASCFICQGKSENKDRENGIVLRTANTIVFLNRYPYNNGHLLVAPTRHLANPEEFQQEEWIEINEVLRGMLSHLGPILKPDGYNLGVNLGRVAGAGLPGHFHWHIVPRWNGDTNFMPVVSDTKVMVQSLDSLFELLTKSLQS